MRFDLWGAFTLIGLGVLLAMLGMVWHEAYNTEYQLTVEEALQGRHVTWIAPGPKMVRLTGIALLRQPERVTERSETRRGAVTQERVYFPLRTPADNRAILVSMPFKDFDDGVLLSDAPDRQMTFRGVLRQTPETTNGQKIEQLFRGVTFPAGACLFVGETSGLKEALWLGVSGVALAICGAGLIALRRARGHVGQGTQGAASAAATAPVDPDGSPARQAGADRPAPASQAHADALAAMAAVVRGLNAPVDEADGGPTTGQDRPDVEEIGGPHAGRAAGNR